MVRPILLAAALLALPALSGAQLVYGSSRYASSNPGGSGAYYLDVTTGAARQLFTGATSPGRITGMTSDGSSLFTAASARFGRWDYGNVGAGPTQLSGFYRVGSNGTSYATGVAGLAYAAGPTGGGSVYGYTNFNAGGSAAFVEDGIYRIDPGVVGSGGVGGAGNMSLVWRHDDLAYNFEGLAFNPADGLFYATNNPSSGVGKGIYTIDALGTGAVTKFADYDAGGFLTSPSGLAIGGGRIWLSDKTGTGTTLRIASLDPATLSYGDLFEADGYASGSQSTSLVWAPGAAVPEPGTLAALGLGALALLRRGRKRR